MDSARQSASPTSTCTSSHLPMGTTRWPRKCARSRRAKVGPASRGGVHKMYLLVGVGWYCSRLHFHGGNVAVVRRGFATSTCQLCVRVHDRATTAQIGVEAAVVLQALVIVDAAHAEDAADVRLPDALCAAPSTRALILRRVRAVLGARPVQQRPTRPPCGALSRSRLAQAPDRHCNHGVPQRLIPLAAQHGFSRAE